MTVIKVIKPGMYTTIQDLGRYNYQRSGMSVSGAMDLFSLRVANILVGNRDDEACIEATLMGPELKFECDALIAVTGGNLNPKINGVKIDMWSAVRVSGEDVLSFGPVKEGCRAYIAVAGGFDVPVVMGSKSTYVKGKIGGFEGRILKAGDSIKISGPNAQLPQGGVKLPEDLIHEFKSDTVVRVVLGPQDDYFTEKGINTFLTSKYKVTNEADRMGYRLSGEKIEHKGGADIISDGITMGSVQVPGHGEPIIMMADRQTTGGYTKIATVITPDINLVGQLKPGDSVSFKSIDIKEAQKAYVDYIKSIEDIRKYVEKHRQSTVNSRKFKVRVNSREFELIVDEIK